MKRPLLFFLVLLGLCLDRQALFAEASDRPNIIFVLTDDQGYGDLGFHGHPLLKTPHLDRFAEESVRFDNFYVSPSCSPTRAALLTGRHEFRSGVTHTQQPREHLHESAVTLPEILKESGYRTAFIGKWHLGGAKGRQYLPQSRGFDWCSTNARGPFVHFDPTFVRNGTRNERKGFREDLFFDEAMSFIDEVQAAGDDPFFCYLATYSPHTPLDAPEEFTAPYRGKTTDEIATYLAMIANVDFNMGRLLGFLDERGLAEDTIVLFMNDNGVTVGLDLYNAGMRGSKCTIWEGGSRAMSFWRHGKRWKPRSIDHLTAHLDVLPTLCALARADIPADLEPSLEGYSLVPFLESQEAPSWTEDRMLFHHVARWPSGLAAQHRHAMAGVRQGDYLLLQSHDCGDPECHPYSSQCTTLRNVAKGNDTATYASGTALFHWGVTPPNRWRLFHSKDDPACKTDLSGKFPELTDTLSKAYEAWWDDVYPEMIGKGGDEGTPLKRGAK